MRDFGVYFEEENCGEAKLYTYVCSCGHVESINENIEYECSNCKNNDYKCISSKYNGGTVTSGMRFKVVEKGDWGFIVERIKTNGKFNKANRTLKLTNEVKNKLYFDYRNNDFSIENNKGEKNPITEYNIPYFFREINDEEFINIVATDKMKNFLKFAKRSFGWLRRYSWSVDYRLSRGLSRIKDKQYYQILANAGFTETFLYSLKEVIDSRYSDSRNIEKYFNIHAIQPHKILNVPKYMLSYIKDIGIHKETLFKLNLLDEKYGAANVKIIMDTLSDECDKDVANDFIIGSIPDFIEVIEKYNYKPKNLIKYLCRDVKLNQGIAFPSNALVLLRDYMRMMAAMKLNPDKYSKSLKKDHDIATMNYKVVKDDIKKEEFKKVVDKDTYKELIYEDRKYNVVLPAEPNDLVLEGKNLSHCVASYVEDVIKEKCKILFIREKNGIDNSLLTVEVRGNRIVQVKGFDNRLAKSEERTFLNKWAEDKNLLYAV